MKLENMTPQVGVLSLDCFESPFNFSNDFFDNQESFSDPSNEELPRQYPETEEEQEERIKSFFDTQFHRTEWKYKQTQLWTIKKLLPASSLNGGGQRSKALGSISEGREGLPTGSIDEDNQKEGPPEQDKTKNKFRGTKVHIRHLPTSISKNEFFEALGFVPKHSHIHFMSGNFMSATLNRPSTGFCYINFINPDEANQFVREYCRFVLVSGMGEEFWASCQFAINQRIPKTKPITLTELHDYEFDQDYLSFRDNFDETNMFKSKLLPEKPNVDEVIKEIDDRKLELKQLAASPLVQFILSKSAASVHLDKVTYNQKYFLKSGEKPILILSQDNTSRQQWLEKQMDNYNVTVTTEKSPSLQSHRTVTVGTPSSASDESNSHVITTPRTVSRKTQSKSSSSEPLLPTPAFPKMLPIKTIPIKLEPSMKSLQEPMVAPVIPDMPAVSVTTSKSRSNFTVDKKPDFSSRFEQPSKTKTDNKASQTTPIQSPVKNGSSNQSKPSNNAATVSSRSKSELGKIVIRKEVRKPRTKSPAKKTTVTLPSASTNGRSSTVPPRSRRYSQSRSNRTYIMEPSSVEKDKFSGRPKPLLGLDLSAVNKNQFPDPKNSTFVVTKPSSNGKATSPFLVPQATLKTAESPSLLGEPPSTVAKNPLNGPLPNSGKSERPSLLGDHPSTLVISKGVPISNKGNNKRLPSKPNPRLSQPIVATRPTSCDKDGTSRAPLLPTPTTMEATFNSSSPKKPPPASRTFRRKSAPKNSKDLASEIKRPTSASNLPSKTDASANGNDNRRNQKLENQRNKTSTMTSRKSCPPAASSKERQAQSKELKPLLSLVIPPPVILKRKSHPVSNNNNNSSSATYINSNKESKSSGTAKSSSSATNGNISANKSSTSSDQEKGRKQRYRRTSWFRKTPVVAQ